MYDGVLRLGTWRRWGRIGQWGYLLGVMGRAEEVDVVIGAEGGASSFVRRWLFDGRSDVYHCDCKWLGEIWGRKVG